MRFYLKGVSCEMFFNYGAARKGGEARKIGDASGKRAPKPVIKGVRLYGSRCRNDFQEP